MSRKWVKRQLKSDNEAGAERSQKIGAHPLSPQGHQGQERRWTLRLCPLSGADPQSSGAEVAKTAEHSLLAGKGTGRRRQEREGMPNCPHMGVDTGTQISFVPWTEPAGRCGTDLHGGAVLAMTGTSPALSDRWLSEHGGVVCGA